MPKIVGALVGGDGLENLADPIPESRIDRSAALRRRALSLAKSCSIGLRSGEYGGS
jgi:hypothetical protein